MAVKLGALWEVYARLQTCDAKNSHSSLWSGQETQSEQIIFELKETRNGDIQNRECLWLSSQKFKILHNKEWQEIKLHRRGLPFKERKSQSGDLQTHRQTFQQNTQQKSSFDAKKTHVKFQVFSNYLNYVFQPLILLQSTNQNWPPKFKFLP